MADRIPDDRCHPDHPPDKLCPWLVGGLLDPATKDKGWRTDKERGQVTMLTPRYLRDGTKVEK